MIRLATPADLSQAADIYEEILDREAQGPVYTNWQRGKYPTIDTARQPPVPLPGLPLRRNGGVLLHGLCAGESQLLRKGPLNPLRRKGFSPLLTVG